MKNEHIVLSKTLEYLIDDHDLFDQVTIWFDEPTLGPVSLCHHEDNKFEYRLAGERQFTHRTINPARHENCYTNIMLQFESTVSPFAITVVDIQSIKGWQIRLRAGYDDSSWAAIALARLVNRAIDWASTFEED